MPKSRKNPKRKDNLKTYKNKKKTMSQNADLAQSMPPIRNIPKWPGESKIEVSGYEWEAILNSFNQLQAGVNAVQSVMSRNIVSGAITMDFEKLNPQTLLYEEMAEDEKAKYKLEFAQAIEAFKAGKQPAAAEQPDVKSALVDVDGQPLAAETKPVLEEAPKKAPAKVVKLKPKEKKEQ